MQRSSAILGGTEPAGNTTMRIFIRFAVRPKNGKFLPLSPLLSVLGIHGGAAYTVLSTTLSKATQWSTWYYRRLGLRFSNSSRIHLFCPTRQREPIHCFLVPSPSSDRITPAIPGTLTTLLRCFCKSDGYYGGLWQIYK